MTFFTELRILWDQIGSAQSPAGLGLDDKPHRVKPLNQV